MIFVYITSLVRYNINTTDLSAGDIKSFVLSAISTYSSTYLNDFNKTLRYSQLVTAIDNANENIVGNETDIEAVKKIRPRLNSNTPIVLDFNFALESGVTSGKLRHNNRSTSPIFSTSFDFQNQVARLQDDGLGSLNIVKADGVSIEKLAPAGTVDYTAGRLNIIGLNIQSYYGSSIKIYVRPLLKDIFSTKNSILQIVADDVEIAIEQVRI